MTRIRSESVIGDRPYVEKQVKLSSSGKAGFGLGLLFLGAAD